MEKYQSFGSNHSNVEKIKTDDEADERVARKKNTMVSSIKSRDNDINVGKLSKES